MATGFDNIWVNIFLIRITACDPRQGFLSSPLAALRRSLLSDCPKNTGDSFSWRRMTSKPIVNLATHVHPVPKLRFEVFAAIKIWIAVLYIMALCGLYLVTKVKVSEECLSPSCALRMDVIYSSETLITTNKTTWPQPGSSEPNLKESCLNSRCTPSCFYFYIL